MAFLIGYQASHSVGNPCSSDILGRAMATAFLSQPARLLKVSEAAERLNISAPTAYRMVTSGALPALRIGSQWRIDPVRFDEWLEARSHG